MAKIYPSPQSCNFERGRAAADGEYFAAEGDRSSRYGFSIAMTNTDRDGNQTDPDFFNFTAWGWVADSINERGGIKKGQKLTVLNARVKSYKDREGGNRVSFTVGHPDDVLTPVGVYAPKLQSREAPVDDEPRSERAPARVAARAADDDEPQAPPRRAPAATARPTAASVARTRVNVPSAIDNDEDLPF